MSTGALLLCAALLLGLVGVVRAEVVQRGQVRVAFEGKLTPRALPRSEVAPISVTVGGRIIPTGRAAASPQLRRISIAVNRYGRFNLGGLPVCHIDQIQPATTEGALEACGRSLVGEGRFSAKVLLPEQAPFPSVGKVFAYNGTYRGKPAILAHVYGGEPAPTSYTLPFQITRTKGVFGTLLSASLPRVTSEWGYVTGISLRLDRTFSQHGEKRGYISAACPAPKGFSGAFFPLARTTFAFAGGVRVGATLNRGCKVRRP
ncbi:MAG TPA: hypothetical protein VGO66_04965 [Solirubrobacterales bacterium]|jgi:hypothetical protein|nr:hypothetical protein [Solirubrobacterales bacterium]